MTNILCHHHDTETSFVCLKGLHYTHFHSYMQPTLIEYKYRSINKLSHHVSTVYINWINYIIAVWAPINIIYHYYWEPLAFSILDIEEPGRLKDSDDRLEYVHFICLYTTTSMRLCKLVLIYSDLLWQYNVVMTWQCNVRVNWIWDCTFPFCCTGIFSVSHWSHHAWQHGLLWDANISKAHDMLVIGSSVQFIYLT